MNKRNNWRWILGLVIVATLIFTGCQQKDASKVMVATDATWPPFEYVEEDSKEIVGFDIDFINAVAEEAGLELEFVNVGFDALLAGMAQGEYDAAISAITITDERRKEMLFSDPYYNAGQVIVVQSGTTDIAAPADLAGKTAGAQIGTTGAMEIEAISGTTLKTYDTVDLAFLDLINGQIDAVVVDNPLAAGYVGQYEGQLEVVGEPFTDEYYGIAVRPDGEDLVEKLNSGIAAVKSKDLIPELEQRWMGAAE